MAYIIVVSLIAAFYFPLAYLKIFGPKITIDDNWISNATNKSISIIIRGNLGDKFYPILAQEIAEIEYKAWRPWTRYSIDKFKRDLEIFGQGVEIAACIDMFGNDEAIYRMQQAIQLTHYDQFKGYHANRINGMLEGRSKRSVKWWDKNKKKVLSFKK